MVDFHTHILPGIDDGSPDAKTSIKMLEELYQRGVDRVVLTPHFYMTSSNMNSFLRHRREAADALIDASLGRDNLPKAVLGAEVLLFPEISGIDGIEKLCIEGTDYMLVEMPFSKWSNITYDTLGKLRSSGIIPIIAHVERYIKIQKDKNMIGRLLDLGCMIQANVSFFTSFWTKRKAVKLVMGDCIHFIGSDCHDLSRRRPDTNEAYLVVEKKAGASGIENLDYMADMVLKDAVYCL